MLTIILSILKFVGTLITGILGIIGIRTETHEEQLIPPKVRGGNTRTRRVLTPQGKKILRWTIVAFAVAVSAQIAEEVKSYLEAAKDEARAELMLSNVTHQLTVATQSLGHIERIMNRFQTLTVDAIYLVPTNHRPLEPFMKELQRVAKLPPTGPKPPGMAVETDERGNRIVEIDLDGCCMVPANTLTDACEVLKSLTRAGFVVDVFTNKSADTAVLSTFESRVLDGPDLIYASVSNHLMVRWHVAFPNDAWFQFREMSNFRDLHGTWFQVAFTNGPRTLFESLTPASLVVACDAERQELEQAEKVTDELWSSRIVQTKKMVAKSIHLPFGGKKTIKAPRIDRIPTLVREKGRKDPRGTLVSIHQARFPDPDDK